MDTVAAFERFADLFGGSRQRQLVVAYFVIVSGVILLYTLLYNVGMAVFEGVRQTPWHSLEVVVQTLTTTGYGQDSDIWSTWQIELLIVFMQLSGFVMIVASLPVFVGPWLRDRLSTSAPTRVPEGFVEHVIIAGYSSRTQALIDELDSREVPYVVIEGDRDAAADLFEQEVTVIHGDPETAYTCRDCANLEHARALVADIDDETNASVALTAKGICDVPVSTFVEDDSLAEYHQLAGADHVFTPRRLIGESLATKVTSGLTTDLADAIALGEDFDVVELPVQSGSELDGKSVREMDVRANVIGAWFRGEFVSPPDPAARIDEQTILLVAGHESELEQLKGLTLSEQRQRDRGTVLIGGYGMVGSTVEAAIEERGFPTVTVDREEMPGVDIVGDVTEEAVLEEAGIGGASTIILALPDDTMTVFATLVVRELDPDIEIVARADAMGSVSKIYQAGADYVLSLATVSGRMLASTILEEDVISFDQQVEIIRSKPGRLVGRSLSDVDIRARTGATVVAVQRNGGLVADLDASYVMQPDDELIVTGTDGDINSFNRLVEGKRVA